ncbi:MAG: type II CRISPR RNA-guided endonuclease Cas9 [Bacteroidales bacterium]|nr:type II CRISPR RNA-guided endonuclease Cas9 [Bacteroidales bacterium]
MKKILGLDLGVSSIGWALIEVNDDNSLSRIIAMNSRIIPDKDVQKNADNFTKGKSISINKDRTIARTARKTYDRYILRRKRLTQILRENDMLPNEALIKLPVLPLWQLRANAATEGQKVSLCELGRVLYHLNQKRGYKSVKSEDDEAQQREYVQSVNNRYNIIRNRNQTIGQYFAKKLKESEVLMPNGVFYTYRTKEQVFPRKAYEEEFDQIMQCQQKFYPDILTDELVTNLKRTIYYQRPLKSCKHLVSLCEFEKHTIVNDGKTITYAPRVAPKSSPLSQVCKLWEETNKIKLRNNQGEELYITQEQRDKIFHHLDNVGTLKCADLYKILGISKKDGWWGGKAIGKGLQGNVTKFKIREALEGTSNCEELLRFNLEIQENSYLNAETGELLDIVSPEFEKEPLYRLWHVLYSISDIDELRKTLISQFGIQDEDTLQKLEKLDFRKDGYGKKSSKFMRRLLPYLQQGLMYSEACDQIGVNHSNSLTAEENKNRTLITQIPLLKKGELRQPVVEMIINQMINIVNAILAEYGTIDEIHVELARELKQSKEERERADKLNKDNEKRNKADAAKILENGLSPTANRIRKYRMWDETLHQCIYCGAHIKVTDFLNGIDAEKEHIIPKALLFDDSFANTTCSCRDCNKAKGKQTAFDFMRGQSPEHFNAYKERIKNLHDKKLISDKKYEYLLTSYNDYLDRKQKGEETDNDKRIWEDFISRQLRESQYIAKHARIILEQVCRNVYATSGSVTATLRKRWGYDNILHNLNLERYRADGKNSMVTIAKEYGQHEEERINDWNKRLDHRHHAIDALVIALTRHNVIQRINTLNAQRDAMTSEVEAQSVEWREKYSLLDKWLQIQPHFPVEYVIEKVSDILISFKKEKGCTIYGKRYSYKNGHKTLEQKHILVPRGSLSERTLYGQISRYVPGGKQEKHIVTRYAIGVGQGFLFSGKEKDLGKAIENTLDSIVDKAARKAIEQRLNQGFAEGDNYHSNPKKALENLTNIQESPIYIDKYGHIPIKAVRCVTGSKTAIPIKYDENKSPIRFVEPGKNHHAAFYQDGNGNILEHIVTFTHAVERAKYRIPIIVTNTEAVWNQCFEQDLPQSFLNLLPPDKCTFKLSLQKQEMFILGMPDELFDDAIKNNDYSTLSKYLYRVQNISKGDYVFRLHIDATNDKASECPNSKRSIRISKIETFFNLHPHKVRITILGQITIL